MSLAVRVHNEARDLVELVLVPGLAALLPWPLCFRVFRVLSRFEFLYRAECMEAVRSAEALGWVRGDRAIWLRTRRLVTLVDHADFYLSRTRSDRWLARHVDITGDWPDGARPGVLCTFHWGAGMWGLRHARTRSMRAHAIVAPQLRRDFPGRLIKFLYCRARVRAVAAALQTEPIEPSHSPRRILRTLRNGEQIVAAIDVPADQVAASESIDFIGRRARVPRGLLRVAADSRIPVTVYLTGIRLIDGKRSLHIHQLGQRDDLRALTNDVFALLQRAIESDPAAWHFWSVAPRFFERDPQASAA